MEILQNGFMAYTYFQIFEDYFDNPSLLLNGCFLEHFSEHISSGVIISGHRQLIQIEIDLND